MMVAVSQMNTFEHNALQLKEKYSIPGVALGIAQDGVPVYEKGFGHRRISEGKPVTMDTVFGIASITKSFVCAAIMQLQEAGKLSVHDPVISHIPSFRIKNGVTDSIKIHHLMTHTSGLPPLPTLFYAGKRSRENDPAVKDYPGLKFRDGDGQESIDTYEQLLDFIAELDFELLGEPGAEFSYSNDGYALLGMIIGVVSGKPLEQYLKENIFEPIKMTNSFVLTKDLQDAEEVTMLYSKRKNSEGEEVYEAPIWWDSPAMRGSGAIKSTVRDLLKYAEIYRTKGLSGDRRILSEESVTAMISPHVECAPGQFYGYGLMITPDYFGDTLIEHGGNSKAIASQMSIIPEKGTTGIVLTNLAGVPASTLMAGALNVYHGRDFDSFPIEDDGHTYQPHELDSYIGHYVSSEGMELTVKSSDSNLLFSVPGETKPIGATPLSKDIFLIKVRDQAEVVRFKWKNGQIDRVAYHFRQFPKVELSE